MSNPIADPLIPNPIAEDVARVVEVVSTPDGVATVTLNRPARKNALDALLIEGLTEAFETLHGADHVRIVFLRGAGGAFCAGADLEWMKAAADYSESENRDDAMNLARMLKALHDVPAMTVALVEGAAMGGGAGLVAACDYAVAVEGTKFSFSEVKLGLIAATISPYVVQAIGPRAAKALFASGRLFGAEEARTWGLVQEVAADAAALEAAADALAKAMAACAPGAVGESKRLVDAVWGREIDHGLTEETARRIARQRVSEEGREGIAAFLEKRKPAWAQ